MIKKSQPIDYEFDMRLRLEETEFVFKYLRDFFQWKKRFKIFL